MINNAAKINEIGTVGLVYGKLSISFVAMLITYRTNPPNIIPKIPETRVKNTDSRIIWVFTSDGVAPIVLFFL